MNKKHDPLSGLDRSLQAETQAVDQRFRDADRFTQPRRQRRPKPAVRAVTVRDTFSFPQPDHKLLSELQGRCLAAGFIASKSELVRAGLHALARMTPQALRQSIDGLEKRKPGPRRRP
jgi:hypothetical protein